MRSAIIPALLILLAGLSSARASGGTWCEIDDQNLKFHIHVAYPRAGGQPIGFESSLQVFSTTAPKEFQAFRFKEADLVESRSDGRPGGSLKMRLVRREETLTLDERIDRAMTNVSSFVGRVLAG